MNSASPREGTGERAGWSKAPVRLEAVRRYQALVAEDPKRGKRSIAAGVIEESGGHLGSVRTLQSRVRKKKPPTAADPRRSSRSSAISDTERQPRFQCCADDVSNRAGGSGEWDQGFNCLTASEPFDRQ